MTDQDDTTGLLDLSSALADALADAEKLAESKDKDSDGGPPEVAAKASEPAPKGKTASQPTSQPASQPTRAPLDVEALKMRARLHGMERDLELERSTVARLRKQLEQSKADLKVTRQRFLRLSEQYEDNAAQLERAQRVLPSEARAKFAKRLLPSLDTLVRVLGHLLHDEQVDPEVRRALELLRDSWQRGFDAVDLEVLEATGLPFDPQVHEAISRRYEPDTPVGVVLEQVDPGYRLEGQVLRSAQVVVSEAADDGGVSASAPTPDD